MLDTISAIATPMGQSGLGVIRISGQNASGVLAKLFVGAARSRAGVAVADWPSHRARFGYVVDPVSGETLDEVVALFMRGPRSYTGEDVVELSCHGGPVVLRRVLQATYRAGARPANPGEYTKRAFLNGRLDLAQAEAVMELIAASTDDSRRVALGQLRGRLSGEVGKLRHDLLGHIATIEALVDFPEDDIGQLDTDALEKGLAGLQKRIQRLVATSETGRILRDGLRTVIVGRPNVGKSSLLNALLRDDRAIVTPVPGTTRDVIEERVDIAGVPVVLSDTAGVREAQDEVERLGVERTQRAIAAAELIILVLDGSSELTAEDRRLMTELPGQTRRLFVVINKADLHPQLVKEAEVKPLVPGQLQVILCVSALTGEGLDELESRLRQLAYSEGRSTVGEVVVLTARHGAALERAGEHLQQATDAIRSGIPADLVTVDLRGAWLALGEITGDSVGDDLLDRIFADFCIGK